MQSDAFALELTTSSLRRALLLHIPWLPEPKLHSEGRYKTEPACWQRKQRSRRHSTVHFDAVGDETKHFGVQGWGYEVTFLSGWSVSQSAARSGAYWPAPALSVNFRFFSC